MSKRPPEDPTPKQRLADATLKPMQPRGYEFCIVDSDGRTVLDWQPTTRNMLRQHFVERDIAIIAESPPGTFMESARDGIRRRFRKRLAPQ